MNLGSSGGHDYRGDHGGRGGQDVRGDGGSGCTQAQIQKRPMTSTHQILLTAAGQSNSTLVRTTPTPPTTPL